MLLLAAHAERPALLILDLCVLVALALLAVLLLITLFACWTKSFNAAFTDAILALLFVGINIANLSLIDSFP